MMTIKKIRTRTVNLYFSLLFAPFNILAADKTAPVGAAPLADPTATGNLLQVSLSLVVVLVLIAATAWLLRRYIQTPTAAQGFLKVLGGVSLGPRERAVLLQVGDKQLLIGVAPGQIHMLHALEQPLIITAREVAISGTFAERLVQAVRQNATPGKAIKRDDSQ